MPKFSITQRLKIAIGGFLSFIGLLVLITAILTFTRTVQFESVFQNELFVPIVITVGLLDIACGLLLVLKGKRFFSSFTSHEKKTSDNTD